MARTLCTHCEKPLKACLCAFITAINNRVNVVILQHPNEVNQSKATVPLIANALSGCTVVVGDDFSHNDTVNTLITRYGKHCLLLYPGESAINLHDYVADMHAAKLAAESMGVELADTQLSGVQLSRVQLSDIPLADIQSAENATPVNHVTSADELCLLVLDGTWKKTYRMYMQSTNLHALTQLTLPDNIEGQYHIRKTKKAHALSTLEACYYCLTALEADDEKGEAKYLPLIENFKKFNDFQLSFRPPEHLNR